MLRGQYSHNHGIWSNGRGNNSCFDDFRSAGHESSTIAKFLEKRGEDFVGSHEGDTKDRVKSIVEESLLEVMYDIPDRTDIRKCIITEETIRSGRLPLLLTKTEIDKGVDETNYEEWLAEGSASA